MIDRMFRAGRLDPTLYREVARNRALTKEALLIVVIGALAAGIGLGLAATPLAMTVGVIGALISWVIMTALVYLVGTRLLAEPGTRAAWRDVLRVMGYAHSPRALLVLIFILSPIVAIAIDLWVLIATVTAVREVFGFTTRSRAVGTALIPWVGSQVIFASILAFA